MLSASAAAADKPTRVGVVVSLHVNMDRDQALALAGQLGTAIAKRVRAEVIAGRDAQRLLPGTVVERCYADRPCVSETGLRLSADELLFLSMVRVGGRTQVDITWVDVRTAKTAIRSAIRLEGGDPAAIFADAAPDLLPHLPVRSTRRRQMTTTSWVTAGAAVALAAAGTTFGLLARSEFNDLETTCPDDCDDSTLSLRRNLADGFFIGAGVAAGATLVLYLISDGAAVDEGSGPTVSAGPSGTWVGWAGRF